MIYHLPRAGHKVLHNTHKNNATSNADIQLKTQVKNKNKENITQKKVKWVVSCFLKEATVFSDHQVQWERV